MTDGQASTRNALGEFLRARRARVQPTDLGLPQGTGNRRTPGLRREELAALSGVSVDYYIRLEQGKEQHPSGAVLTALARALRLDEDARDHLFALADRLAGRAPQRRADNTVRAGIRQLLETLRPCPAYVRNRTNDILAANPEGLALLAGIAEWPQERRNTTRYLFRHPIARTLYPDWMHAARMSVAQLRAASIGDQDDALASLVAELTEASPEFAELWQRHDVQHRRTERKTLQHPVVGTLNLMYESLDVAPDGTRLGVYQAAPGTPDHEALTLLSLAAGAA
ncbi:helix-turn-helix transcriptional regulator [Humibacter ginsenosidimutans]|uniref:Helix-turn-helix domain-containing protein n=1 Tax=Humibacter ginsenosidimutans TaxID=2599293 RepID=A0A5B8M6N5_9MICO|nr:helix-turn-helix transcriptional regulator [Humibacter ginsenosidimutans]QDZ15170.1 helix-turn-helix domain-containing protein [Humibacter ginsenosidimutans]